MNRFLRNVLLYLLIIVSLIMMFDRFSETGETKKEELTYTDFLRYVQTEQVQGVTIVENTIKGKLKDGKEFTTVTPTGTDIVKVLEEKKVDIKAELPPQQPWWMNLLTSLLPMLVIVAIWFMMMNNSGAGGGKVFQFGKS